MIDNTIFDGLFDPFCVSSSRDAGPDLLAVRLLSVSDFVDLHPGGAKIIKANSGKDVTKLFKPIHPPNAIEDNREHVRVVGRVESLAVGEGETEEESRIREARANMPHVDTVVNIQDFARACKDILSAKAAAYYSSGADDEKGAFVQL